VLDRDEFDVPQMLSESLQDLNQLAEFLNELRQFKPSHDDKLRALIKLLKTDPVLKKHKVMIFSEFMATARYLATSWKRPASRALTRSTPHQAQPQRRDSPVCPVLQRHDQQRPARQGGPETRVLIATDVLSEGLNLQDATRLINYDLHWNPVRLMQRIGRVDRRMNPEIEKKLIKDHPDVKAIRGTVEYWNFLPPGELDELLNLYKKSPTRPC
jgi:superfamily II DNA/RNA helicase